MESMESRLDSIDSFDSLDSIEKERNSSCSAGRAAISGWIRGFSRISCSSRRSGSKEEGGFREKLTALRTDARAQQEGSPACPECGKPMKKRTAKTGAKAGLEFWGCTGYPDCKGLRQVE